MAISNLNKKPDPNEYVRVYIPRHMSDRLSDMADELGVGKRHVTAFIVREGIAHFDRFPTPPSKRPAPTMDEAFLSYARGEKILGPCGERLPCGYNEDWEEYGRYAFCKKCRVRLR